MNATLHRGGTCLDPSSLRLQKFFQRTSDGVTKMGVNILNFVVDRSICVN